MKEKRLLHMPLAAILVLSILRVTMVPAWVPPGQPNATWLYVEDYEFFTEADLTGTQFNITVNIYNVDRMGSFQFKLGYNTTLLDAVWCTLTPISQQYFTSLMPTPWNETNGIIDDQGYVVFGAGYPDDINNPFSGSGALLTITFEITLAPPREVVSVPENRTVSCPLDIYGTDLWYLGPYPDYDTYPVTTPIDDGSYSYTRPQIVTENQPPVLDPIGDKSVDELATLSFTATASDTDIPPQTLTFSLGPGAPPGAVITSGGYFTWTPTEAQGPGLYYINITVSDSVDIDYEVIGVTVNEVNAAPVASFTPSTTEAYVNTTILFDASASTDPDGTIVQYAWDFENDGIVDAYGVTTEHKYTMAGSYIVKLTVTDDGEPPLSDTTTATIIISEVEVLVPDLKRRSAWPDHHHFVEAKHGTINVLHARMGNPAGIDYDVYVKFSIYAVAKGIDLRGTLTAGSEVAPITLAAGAIPIDTSTDFDIYDDRWVDLAKVYVKAELFYWDGTEWVEGAKDKWFSFAIVRM